jgi:flagellar motor switch protein FliN/FliY
MEENSSEANSDQEMENENLEQEGEQAQDQEERTLDFILDIPLELSVELGRTRMLVNDLLQLGQGSIVELNKLAGEPLEVYINRKLIARGEVVVVNEKFGVRLTDIITPMDRVKSLAE